MKTKYIAALVILASAASSAFATGALSDRASDIDRIVQGHGKPGDTADNFSPDAHRGLISLEPDAPGHG